MHNLNKKALVGLFFLLIVMAALLFIPAWTFDYWRAWVFLVVFFLPAFAITIYLMKNDPMLLARRVQAGPTAEKETNQKIIQTVTSAGFISMLVVPALDHRYNWSEVPTSLSLAGNLLILFGFLIVFFVYKENPFASATIELAPDQKVVSTGLYALVRHPMYLGGLFWFVGMALSLGSWWGSCLFALMIPALIWRLLNEENFLARNLPDYPQYQKQVRYRLLPFVW